MIDTMVTIQHVISHLEAIAPRQYQESYDNAGLIVGDPSQPVTGIITCLDSTEDVIDEALQRGCNLIVAHHPIIFKGLKTLTGKNYVERTIIKAIQKGVAIYAIHTNLDNILHRGVNQRIGHMLGLQAGRILAPKKANVQWLVTLTRDLENARKKLTSLGVHVLGGDSGTVHLIFPKGEKAKVQAVLSELGVPFDQVVSMADPQQTVADLGSGLIGELPEAMEEEAFLDYVKLRMKAGCIRHTALRQKKIRRVALCGGAGGFLLPIAKANGADIFVTADYKYHEFFDADDKIIIADIGHFESEQYTIDMLQEILSEKFSTFATYCTSVRTNPVFYR